MRALTVSEPWASAIMWLGKDVENRTWAPANGWRGTLVIHSGRRIDSAAMEIPTLAPLRAGTDKTRGMILGTVELLSVHRETDPVCHCGKWAQYTGDPVKPMLHWGLRNPLLLVTSIPAVGKLGLWDVGPTAESLLKSQPFTYPDGTPA